MPIFRISGLQFKLTLLPAIVPTIIQLLSLATFLQRRGRNLFVFVPCGRKTTISCTRWHLPGKEPITDSKALRLVTRKLKRLKLRLKEWNHLVFGDIFRNMESAQAQLVALQEEISNAGYSDELFYKEIDAHNELNRCMRAHTEFFRQKSRISWLTEGDRNTSFFHRMAGSSTQHYNSLY